MEIILSLLSSLLHILKEVGAIGLLLIFFIAAVIFIARYFTLQQVKVENFYLKEKEKFENQQKIDADKIYDLTKLLLEIRDKNIDKLEEANHSLIAVNELLRKKIYGD